MNAKAENTNEPRGILSVLKRFVRRFLPEYVITVDYDGEVRKARIKRLANGTVLAKKIYGWIILLPDGTCSEGNKGYCYVIKWHPLTNNTDNYA